MYILTEKKNFFLNTLMINLDLVALTLLLKNPTDYYLSNKKWAII